MIYFLILAASMFLSVVIQHFTGEMLWLGGKIHILPVVFFFAAAALPLPAMFSLAVLAGLMWDALIFHPNASGTYETAFGWSVLLYGAFGAVMNGLRPLFLRGRWELHCFVAGLLTAVMELIAFLIITFRREPFDFVWPTIVWSRIGGSGLAAMLLAIPVFIAFTWLGRRLHVIRYDTMRPD